jgi:hypothetical protein
VGERKFFVKGKASAGNVRQTIIRRGGAAKAKLEI